MEESQDRKEALSIERPDYFQWRRSMYRSEEDLGDLGDADNLGADTPLSPQKVPGFIVDSPDEEKDEKRNKLTMPPWILDESLKESSTGSSIPDEGQTRRAKWRQIPSVYGFSQEFTDPLGETLEGGDPLGKVGSLNTLLESLEQQKEQIKQTERAAEIEYTSEVYRPWFSYGMAVVQICIFVASLFVNAHVMGRHVEPFSSNIMIGPSTYVSCLCW
jgi:hypothetical protein